MKGEGVHFFLREGNGQKRKLIFYLLLFIAGRRRGGQDRPPIIKPPIIKPLSIEETIDTLTRVSVKPT